MTDDPPTTLVVRLEETDEFFDQLHADVEAMEQGEQPEHPHSLSVPDLEALEDIFTERNLELVRAIRHHEPESMRAAARLVDRDIKNVSTALNRLAELGLVEIEQDGRSKRPVVTYDDIRIEINLDESGADSESAISA
ncbi:HVO_A0114 family putative DNA-binding protein [Candidatus Halobonum tyrrellensis]|nr:hypothetical protein [Candidatus Halobonum tyrrellensis]